MNITLIDFHNSPNLRRAMEASARRERSRHIGALIGSALAALITRKPGRVAAYAPERATA